MQRALLVQAVFHLVHGRCVATVVGCAAFRVSVGLVVVNFAARVGLLQQVGVVSELTAEVLRQVLDEAVQDVVLEGEELLSGRPLGVVVSLRMQKDSLRLALPGRDPEPP